jgi:hypothetical protein
LFYEFSPESWDEKPWKPPDRDRAMTRVGVCVTVLLFVGCAPGADVIYGSSIRPGGGLPSITTMALGRVRAQPAPAAPAAPASAASSPDRRGVGIGQPRQRRANRRAKPPTDVTPISAPPRVWVPEYVHSVEGI